MLREHSKIWLTETNPAHHFSDAFCKHQQKCFCTTHLVAISAMAFVWMMLVNILLHRCLSHMMTEISDFPEKWIQEMIWIWLHISGATHCHLWAPVHSCIVTGKCMNFFVGRASEPPLPYDTMSCGWECIAFKGNYRSRFEWRWLTPGLSTRTGILSFNPTCLMRCP